MANEHRLDQPKIVEQDGKLHVDVSFYRAGYLTGGVRCILQIFHDGVIEDDEDDKLIHETHKNMKLVDFASHIYEAKFEVPIEKGGSISIDLQVIRLDNSVELAKASYRLGPKLNERTKISRADRAPRMLHAINTAEGPKPKPTTADKLDDILEHIHAALIDNDAFRNGIASSTDGQLSNRRQMSSDELTRVDEKLSLIITEKLLGLPYQMPGNVYGNCQTPDVNNKLRLVHLNNHVFWERMRPGSEEITYPWCTECQQLTTQVNYLRGVDIWALAPGAKGEMGAQRPSFKVAEAAGGKTIPDEDANGNLDPALYTDDKHPLGPGDFFVFNAEKWQYKEGDEIVYVEKSVVEGWSDEEREHKEKHQELELVPAQHPKNHPHISCILRVYKRAGNYFFQLMDTGGQFPMTEGYALMRRSEPSKEGTCDGRFITMVRPDGDAAGVAPCIGIGIWPGAYKTDLAKLERAYERARCARPVACARLFLIERASGAVLYATPILRTYTADPEQNFPPSRLAWSLRNTPHNGEIMAMWAIWGPRGPLAKRLIGSRHVTLFDVRSEFAGSTAPSKEFNNVVLGKFRYGETQGFLFLQNIATMSPKDAEDAHAGKVEFRFPTNDKDPNYYKTKVYAEVTRVNNAHQPKSWVQDKRYDLNAYPWDQHIFGDRSVRTIIKRITSTEPTQTLQLVEGNVEIDAEQFATITGKWYGKGPHEASPVIQPGGKLVQGPGGPKDGKIAPAAEVADQKQHVELTLPKSAAALAGSDEVRLLVELAVPVIDRRYARPDKFDSYPYFRGDFPMRPANCPGGKPGPDACGDWDPDACPSDCAYIVKLRGLKLGAKASLSPEFSEGVSDYTAKVSYLGGEALTVTASTSCKATITAKLGAKQVSTATGVESAPLGLAQGANTVIVEAKATNGSTAKVTLEIERAAPSKEHSLAALKVAPGKLVQAQDHAAGFAAQVLEYELVDTQEFKIAVTPTLTDELAKLSVDGQAHASATEKQLSKPGFGAHEIAIDVVAEDGGSSAYRIVYYRGNDNNQLKALEVFAYAGAKHLQTTTVDTAEQAANAAKESHAIEVPDATTRVRIKALAAAGTTSKVFLDGKQMWGAKDLKLANEVEGEPPLQNTGSTVALVEVQAQNGRRRTYELQIRRPKDAATPED